MNTTYGQWALTTNKNQGSRLSNLTSGTAAGKIKYVANGIKGAGTVTDNGTNTANGPAGVTGIVFPLFQGALGGAPFSDATKKNQIGDPDELNYSLTTGDFFTAGDNSVEKDGGAQKVINAILDTAYVAYNSGVQLGSGLSSMTVSRGDLSLGSTQVTGISGAINKYSRSYTVTFSYTQTGFIANINGALHSEALPDISDDLKDEDTDPKPF